MLTFDSLRIVLFAVSLANASFFFFLSLSILSLSTLFFHFLLLSTNKTFFLVSLCVNCLALNRSNLVMYLCLASRRKSLYSELGSTAVQKCTIVPRYKSTAVLQRGTFLVPLSVPWILLQKCTVFGTVVTF